MTILKAGDLAKEGYEFISIVIRAAYERLLVATGVVGSKAPTHDRKAKGSPPVAKGDASPPNLPPSWPTDVGFMRTSSGASSPLAPRKQAKHVKAPTRCSSWHKTLCIRGAVHGIRPR